MTSSNPDLGVNATRLPVWNTAARRHADARFDERCRTHYGGSPTLRYGNHLTSNGTWVGHPDYAGQFLMFDPTKQASAAFLSALD
jgi:CubicO group peptidase (beta-lactamase class C family)